MNVRVSGVFPLRLAVVDGWYLIIRMLCIGYRQSIQYKKIINGITKSLHIKLCIAFGCGWLRSTVEECRYCRANFPVLHLTCSWLVTTYVGKPSAVLGRPTRPTQPFILSGLINWVASRHLVCPTSFMWYLVNACEVMAGSNWLDR